MHDFAFIFAGFFVGIVVGLTGVGGGSLMPPILIFFFGVKPYLAVGTDLLFAAFTKMGGTVSLARQRLVPWRVVVHLCAGSIPAALLTLYVLHTVGPADPAGQRARLLARLRSGGELERGHGVLGRIHLRQELKGLKDEADVARSPGGTRVFVEIEQALAEGPDAALGRQVESGHQAQKGRFPRSAFAHDGERLAGVHVEGHAVHGAHGALRRGEVHLEPRDREERAREVAGSAHRTSSTGTTQRRSRPEPAGTSAGTTVAEPPAPGGEVARPTSTELAPFAVGQWSKYRTTMDDGTTAEITYKIVGEERGAHWIEIVRGASEAGTVMQLLVKLTSRSDPNLSLIHI